MKKMLPVAMLAAFALISFTSFSAVKPKEKPAANAVAVPPLIWPITGTYGAFTYSIQTTDHISFYKNGAFVASYSFTQDYPNQVWGASIDRNVIPGLINVNLAIYGNPAQYNLDLVSL